MRLQEPLSDCLVDSDDAAQRRAGRRRRISLLLSVAAQASLLLSVLIAPLLASETLRAKWREPVVPWRGVELVTPPPADNPPHPNRPPGRPPIQLNPNVIIAPPTIPRDIVILNEEPVGTGQPAGNQTPCPGCSTLTNGFAEGLPLPRDAGPRPPLPPRVESRPAQHQRVVRGEGVQRALLIHRVEPRYPSLARSARVQGTVELRAIIARDGSIQSLEALSGHPLLVRAARDAIGQWRYQPTLLHGEPVEVETRITVIFTLDR